MRVLKPGGVLLNFDANWYGYLYDEEKKKRTRQTGRKWKSSSSTIIICARTLTAWKILRARCRSLRWNGRRGIRRCSNPRRLFHPDRFRNLEARLERGRETELCIDTDVSGARGKSAEQPFQLGDVTVRRGENIRGFPKTASGIRRQNRAIW